MEEYEVGRIGGRLDSMERRMDRFEALVDIRLGGLNEKLDAIIAIQLRQEGGHAAIGGLTTRLVAGLAACSALVVWALSKFAGGGGAH